MGNVREYFEALKFNPSFHMELGDIRLTPAMQEELCAIEELLIKDIEKFKQNNRYQRGYHDGEQAAIKKELNILLDKEAAK